MPWLDFTCMAALAVRNLNRVTNTDLRDFFLSATSPNKKQKRDEEPSSTASVSGALVVALYFVVYLLKMLSKCTFAEIVYSGADQMVNVWITCNWNKAHLSGT